MYIVEYYYIIATQMCTGYKSTLLHVYIHILHAKLYMVTEVIVTENIFKKEEMIMVWDRTHNNIDLPNELSTPTLSGFDLILHKNIIVYLVD